MYTYYTCMRVHVRTRNNTLTSLLSKVSVNSKRFESSSGVPLKRFSSRASYRIRLETKVRKSGSRRIALSHVKVI